MENTNAKWLLDAPAYDGGKYAEGLYNIGGGAKLTPESETGRLMVVSETNKDEFTAYLEKVANEGYTKTFENEVNGNLFAEFVKDGVMLYTYFTPHNAQAHIITDNECCPTSEFGYTYTPAKEDTSAFIQYGLIYDPTGKGGYKPPEKPFENCGSFFIIRLADNSVVLIDGGWDPQATLEITEGVMQYLREITGVKAPEKVRVAAVFISHGHGDHVRMIKNLVNHYADQIVIERAMYNLPNSDEEVRGGGGAYFAEFGTELMTAFPEAKFSKLHTGQKFNLANVQFEVVFTHEDRVDPVTGHSLIVDYNASSTILKLTMSGGKTVMALGDWGGNWTCGIRENEMAAYRGEEATLFGMYGDEDGNSEFLKSDVVQIAHHAINTWMGKVYTAIHADHAFFAQQDVSYEEMAHGCYRDVVNQLRATGMTDDRMYFGGRKTQLLTFTEDGEMLYSNYPLMCFNELYLEMLKQHKPFN